MGDSNADCGAKNIGDFSSKTSRRDCLLFFRAFTWHSYISTRVLPLSRMNSPKSPLVIRIAVVVPFVILHVFRNFAYMRMVITPMKIEVRWIGCLTSQLTIFQSYMWRHIDVQADWRSSCTYGRAPNAVAPTRDHPFLYGDSDTQPQ